MKELESIIWDTIQLYIQKDHKIRNEDKLEELLSGLDTNIAKVANEYFIRETKSLFDEIIELKKDKRDLMSHIDCLKHDLKNTKGKLEVLE